MIKEMGEYVKLLRYLIVVLVVVTHSLFGMGAWIRNPHGGRGDDGYYRQWMSLEFEDSQMYKDMGEIATPAPPYYNPESLRDLSINAIAKKIDNSEITLEQAKKIIPEDLHRQLESEVQRLQKQNPNKSRLTPELEKMMREALGDFEKESAVKK